MTSVDLSAALRAAAAHFDHHSELVDDAAAVSVNVHGLLRVQVYRHESHLAAFAAWVPTLGDAKPVRVHLHADGETVSLELDGVLVDGLPVEIVCLPDRDELDLLAANTPMVDGATFRVGLLLRLTADKRTCESPGDQEHDHAMCEDAVADAATEARA